MQKNILIELHQNMTSVHDGQRGKRWGDRLEKLSDVSNQNI